MDLIEIMTRIAHLMPKSKLLDIQDRESNEPSLYIRAALRKNLEGDVPDRVLCFGIPSPAFPVCKHKLRS